MKTILGLFVSVLMAAIAYTDDTGALQALQTPLASFITILNDPAYQEKGQRDLQDKRLREVINTVFDFDAIARRAVGRSWRRFKPEERKAFAAAFADLLSSNYIRKIQGAFEEEKIAYIGERTLSASRSLVRTKIVREDLEIPVDYSMDLSDNVWKIYDVNIEGVSLIKNYRSQFSSLLRKKTPGQLIQQIEEKVKRQKGKREKRRN